MMQAAPVLQARLPHAPWEKAHTRRLPGIQPLDLREWLVVDDAYAGQMALRDRLLAERPEAVLALAPGAEAAAAELLELVLTHLPRLGFQMGETIARPDGQRVPVDREAPLMTLGRLCQEDFCILQSEASEHVLTGAVLCFPASWALSEKFLRPLTAIHTPVPEYDETLARRVQRLFDVVRPEQPLWRANALLYADSALHAPRREDDPRRQSAETPRFLRSERQCLLRLPRSGAVIFSIHTYVLALTALTPEQRTALQRQIP